MCQNGQGCYAIFHILEYLNEVRRPCHQWNVFAKVIGVQFTQRFDTHFKVWRVVVVKNIMRPMKECRPWIYVGSFQSLIILNSGFSGTLPVGVGSWPTYSTLSFKNSQFSSLNLTRYFFEYLTYTSKINQDKVEVGGPCQ